MDTQLDFYTVKDLEARYRVTRSRVYARINGLKEKGYSVEPEKVEGRSIFNADQVGLLDRLDSHMRAGKDINDFPGVDGRVVNENVSPVSIQVQVSRETVRQLERTELDALPAALGIATVIDAIADKLVAASQKRDPLENLRLLQEACDRGWQLRSSQLAPLLGLKSLHGPEIKRHGFTFTKVGRIGAEGAWKVSRD